MSGSFNILESAMMAQWEGCLKDDNKHGPDGNKSPLNCGSAKFMEEGDILFHKKVQYYQAIGSYSKALAFAGGNLKEVALALNKRAAVLMTVGLYKECIDDVKKAILLVECPENLKQEAYKMLAICCKKLGLNEEAEKHFLECCELIGKNVSPENQVAVLARAKLDFENDFQPKLTKVGIEYSKVPTLSYGDHQNVTGISSALDVLKNKKFGSHFKANKKINPGDILCVEDPLVSSLTEKNSHENMEEETNYTHCFHCFKPSYNLMPCSCNFAMFCGDECKKAAWESYHQEECQARQTFSRNWEDPGDPSGYLNLAFMCIKVVSTFGAKVCSRAMSHPSEAPQALKDFLGLPQASLCSLTLASLKSLASDITSDYEESSSETKNLADFIIKAIKVLRKESINLLQTQYHAGTDTFQRYWEYGWGLYMNRACIRHSCVPNCTQVFYGGKTLAIVAIRPINPGELITVSYKLDVLDMKVEERREYLERHQFICECEACNNGWNLKNYLKKDANLRKHPAIADGSYKGVFESVTDLTFCNQGLACVQDEQLFKKCLEVQEKFLSAGVPKSDFTFAHIQNFIERHIENSARKFCIDGTGEPFIYAPDAKKLQENLLKLKMEKQRQEKYGWQ